MKKSIVSTAYPRRHGHSILISTLLLAGVAVTPATAAPTDKPAPAQVSGSDCGRALPNVQVCLTRASQSSFETGSNDALKAVADSLRSGITTDKGPSLHYRTYWLAYADYLIATQSLRQKRVDDVRAATLEAETLLDNVANKDQETYALQNLVILLRFATAQPSEIGVLMSKTADLKTRLSGTTSIRGRYALALADFYTPAQYGGGRQAEGLLRQVLATPPEPSTPLQPTWGQDDSAALLIQLLRKQAANDQAATVYTTWQTKYPNSVALASVAKP